MHQTQAQIFFGVRHADVPATLRVTENMVTAPHPAKQPTVSFQHFDELRASHGGYCNHQDISRQGMIGPRLLDDLVATIM